uniref:F-box domain-containing protein n=1 Tax=Mycena chlorophos TaxID=658473 RepID=A0ABQ0M6Z1_MYCCL|nr:predicted protein [Mycena chlorophos]
MRVINNSIPSALEGKLPAVASLDIWVFRPGFDPLYAFVPFKNMSKLRMLSLSGIMISLDAVPWNQLHSLALASLTFRRYSEILQYTTNLRFCRLELSSHRSNEDSIPIHLPHLHALVLGVEKFKLPAADMYLNAFTLPSLERLQIEAYLLQQNPQDQLEGLQKRSTCKLKELRVVGQKDIIIPQAEIDSLRAMVPHIEVVDFRPVVPNLVWAETLTKKTTDTRDSIFMLPPS